MSTSLRFTEHEEFHRTALTMALAGGGAGLLAHVTGLLIPQFAPLTAPLALVLVAAATTWGALPPRDRGHLKTLASLLLGSLFAAGGLILFAGRGPEPSLGAGLFALAFGLLLARGTHGKRFWATLLGSMAALLLARWVLTRFAGAEELRALPDWLAAAITGAGFAGVAILSRLPRHVEIRQDRVADAWESVQAQGELKELLLRAMDVWTRVDASLDKDSDERRAVEDAVLRLFEVARRWQSVETEGEGGRKVDVLVARIEEMDAKIESLEDPVARAQYQQARAALADQLRYLREIATSRERVLGRVHHYVAAMESLRYAVLNHRSADASRLSGEIQPLLDDLETLGKEIDLTSQAMGEVEAERAGPDPV